MSDNSRDAPVKELHIAGNSIFHLVRNVPDSYHTHTLCGLELRSLDWRWCVAEKHREGLALCGNCKRGAPRRLCTADQVKTPRVETVDAEPVAPAVAPSTGSSPQAPAAFKVLGATTVEAKHHHLPELTFTARIDPERDEAVLARSDFEALLRALDEKRADAVLFRGALAALLDKKGA